MNIKSKLPTVGTTIFTVMSKMAADYGAINLSQGYPDFSVPEPLLERLNYYARRGENQYPPMHGVAYLREQISLKLRDCYNLTVNSETEITVTSGATEAIFVAIQSLVNPGDEVIVFDPAYDCYEPAINLAGGSAVHIPLTSGDFQVDWDRVKLAINKRTRAIVVNTPHNPTGSVWAPHDLDQLASLVSDSDIAVISDEVYEHMVYDDCSHQCLAEHPGLRDRTFVVSSFGKTYHATGWKVGYCVAPPALTTEFRKIHQFVTFTTHTPTQWAIADYLEHHPEHHIGLSTFYEDKRDLFLQEMQGTGFTLAPSAGTYFQLAGYESLSCEPDVEFAANLTKNAGVAAIPVSVFYQHPPQSRFVRFCFAKEDGTLREAANRLREYFA